MQELLNNSVKQQWRLMGVAWPERRPRHALPRSAWFSLAGPARDLARQKLDVLWSPSRARREPGVQLSSSSHMCRC